MSTELGIPDFRTSRNAIYGGRNLDWAQASYRDAHPKEFKAKIEAVKKSIVGDDKFLRNLFDDSVPAAAEFEEDYYFCCSGYRYVNGLSQRFKAPIVTQNVDGVHANKKAADVPFDLIELHGNVFKNNMILFGDYLADDVMRKLDKLMKTADYVLCIGTSLSTQPVASLADLGIKYDIVVKDKSAISKHILKNASNVVECSASGLHFRMRAGC